jgi:hypothetical protein
MLYIVLETLIQQANVAESVVRWAMFSTTSFGNRVEADARAASSSIDRPSRALDPVPLMADSIEVRVREKR